MDGSKGTSGSVYYSGGLRFKVGPRGRGMRVWSGRGKTEAEVDASIIFYLACYVQMPNIYSRLPCISFKCGPRQKHRRHPCTYHCRLAPPNVATSEVDIAARIYGVVYIQRDLPSLLPRKSSQPNIHTGVRAWSLTTIYCYYYCYCTRLLLLLLLLLYQTQYCPSH